MTNDVRVIECEQLHTAGVRKTVAMTELTQFFSQAFAQTMKALEARGVEVVGPPFGKYYGHPGRTVDVEAGFPIAEPITRHGQVGPGLLPGGRVVEAIHVGPYDTMGLTYAAIERFFAAEGLTPGPIMWESYLSDPDAEPDPAQWRTRICWPIAGGGATGS
jgi:effector-binding domain-containing protein